MKKIKSIGIAALYFLLYYVSQFAVIMICAFVYGMSHIRDFYVDGVIDQNAWTTMLNDFLSGNLFLMTIVSDIVFIFAVFLILKEKKKKFFPELGIYKTNPLNIVPIAALGFSLNILIIVVMSLLPESWLEVYDENSSWLSGATGAVAFISVVVIGPIVEEILFRGLIFTRLSRGFGIYVSAVLSAVVFGFAHGDLVWGIYAGIFGLVLAALFVYTRSLVCPILLHMSFNLAGYFINAINIFLIIIAFIVACLSVVALIFIKKTGEAPRAAEQNDLNE